MAVHGSSSHLDQVPTASALELSLARSLSLPLSLSLKHQEDVLLSTGIQVGVMTAL